MSLFRVLSPSIAVLGISAVILGAGLSCALSPAWAGGLSCPREIADLFDSGGQPGDEGKLSVVAKPLADATDVAAEEDDARDCLCLVGRARKALGF